jgi:hypothetical protein
MLPVHVSKAKMNSCATSGRVNVAVKLALKGPEAMGQTGPPICSADATVQFPGVQA